MLKKLLTILSALLLGFVFPAAGKKPSGPVSLEPSSKWIMQYEDDSCRLLRSFGEDDRSIVLTMSRYGLGHSFNITIAGDRLKTTNLHRPLQLQFGAHEREFEVEFFRGKLGLRKALVGKERIRIAPLTEEQKNLVKEWKPNSGVSPVIPIAKEQYSAANYLKVTRARKFSYILKTGSLDKPFAAMDACIGQLLTEWGIDVEKHKTLSRYVTPTNNPKQWIKSEDYPPDMLFAGQPALVQFRLSIDAQGKVTDCHIQKTTRRKEFDNAVCRNLKRKARFSPALDKDGNAIASYWRNTVRFQMGI